MNSAKKLPPARDLLKLARELSFPLTCVETRRRAARTGFSKTMMDFLDLFPDDEIFENRADFITRCEELEIFINQEREMPQEYLRSPQG